MVMVPKLSRRRMSSASFVPGPLPLATIRRFKLSAVFRVYLLLHTRLRLRATPRLAGPFTAKFGLSKRDAQRGLAQPERWGWCASPGSAVARPRLTCSMSRVRATSLMNRPNAQSGDADQCSGTPGCGNGDDRSTSQHGFRTRCTPA